MAVLLGRGLSVPWEPDQALPEPVVVRVGLPGLREGRRDPEPGPGTAHPGLHLPRVQPTAGLSVWKGTELGTLLKGGGELFSFNFVCSKQLAGTGEAGQGHQGTCKAARQSPVDEGVRICGSECAQGVPGVCTRRPQASSLSLLPGTAGELGAGPVGAASSASYLFTRSERVGGQAVSPPAVPPFPDEGGTRISAGLGLVEGPVWQTEPPTLSYSRLLGVEAEGVRTGLQ